MTAIHLPHPHPPRWYKLANLLGVAIIWTWGGYEMWRAHPWENR